MRTCKLKNCTPKYMCSVYILYICTYDNECTETVHTYVCSYLSTGRYYVHKINNDTVVIKVMTVPLHECVPTPARLMRAYCTLTPWKNDFSIVSNMTLPVGFIQRRDCPVRFCFWRPWQGNTHTLTYITYI